MARISKLLVSSEWERVAQYSFGQSCSGGVVGSSVDIVLNEAAGGGPVLDRESDFDSAWKRGAPSIKDEQLLVIYIT